MLILILLSTLFCVISIIFVPVWLNRRRQSTHWSLSNFDRRLRPSVFIAALIAVGFQLAVVLSILILFAIGFALSIVSFILSRYFPRFAHLQKEEIASFAGALVLGALTASVLLSLIHGHQDKQRDEKVALFFIGSAIATLGLACTLLMDFIIEPKFTIHSSLFYGSLYSFIASAIVVFTWETIVARFKKGLNQNCFDKRASFFMVGLQCIDISILLSMPILGKANTPFINSDLLFLWPIIPVFARSLIVLTSTIALFAVQSHKQELQEYDWWRIELVSALLHLIAVLTLLFWIFQASLFILVQVSIISILMNLALYSYKSFYQRFISSRISSMLLKVGFGLFISGLFILAYILNVHSSIVYARFLIPIAVVWSISYCYGVTTIAHKNNPVDQE